MKILISFRGDYSTVLHPNAVCNNIKENIIQPLYTSGNEVDTLFFTYPSDIVKLGIYETSLKPIHTCFTPYGQIINLKEAMSYIKDIYHTYDYIIFLRFDIIYKMNINLWNIFNKEGITFTYKEDSESLFTTHQYYGDVIISISNKSFKDVYYAMICIPQRDFILQTLHNFGSIIQEAFPDIQILTIIDGYFQSNTGIPTGDSRLNPIYIQVKYPYNGPDKEKYIEYLNTIS